MCSLTITHSAKPHVMTQRPSQPHPLTVLPLHHHSLSTTLPQSLHHTSIVSPTHLHSLTATPPYCQARFQHISLCSTNLSKPQPLLRTRMIRAQMSESENFTLLKCYYLTNNPDSHCHFLNNILYAIFPFFDVEFKPRSENENNQHISLISFNQDQLFHLSFPS